ncbi:MAG: SoxR reducing system RseC family protein [Candidatus Margulisiibacteriota bacterium]|jgi:positive regulator of sigma E activity
MQEQGKVLKVEGNLAFIELEKRAACGYCHACDINPDKNILKIINDPKASAGKKVIVAIPDSNFLLIGTLVYIIPLFIFILAYLLGDGIARKFLAYSDQYILAGLAVAALALTIYYLLLRYFDKVYRNNLQHKPKIVKIL